MTSWHRRLKSSSRYPDKTNRKKSADGCSRFAAHHDDETPAGGGLNRGEWRWGGSRRETLVEGISAQVAFGRTTAATDRRPESATDAVR